MRKLTYKELELLNCIMYYCTVLILTISLEDNISPQLLSVFVVGCFGLSIIYYIIKKVKM